MSVQLQLWEDATKTPAIPELTAQPKAEVAAAASPAAAVAPLPDVKTDVLSTLRKQIRRVETSRRPKSQAISSGVVPLDAVLPQAGYPPGSLVEWISDGQADGAAWLSLWGARSAHEHSGGKVVILDADRTFYPPAVIACGLPAEAIVLLQPKSPADAMWAIDQSLRSSAVAAVWGPVANLEDRDARRLQLAAETGGTLGMLQRPLSAIRQASWAEVRWQVRGVAPQSRQQPAGSDRLLSVRLLRAHGTQAGQHLMLQIDQQARVIRKELPRESKSAQHLAAELAHPKTSRRSRQARRA